MEIICTTLLIYHSSPMSLFLSCFVSEITHTRLLAAVMRERTIAVRVLQFIWQTFDFALIFKPFYDFTRHLSPSKISLLTNTLTTPPPKQTQQYLKFKSKFLSKIKTLLHPSSVPLAISVLISHCVHLIHSHPTIETEEHNILQWAVGCFIFLRCLVPYIISLSTHPNTPNNEKQALVLIGRFLMRLSSGSEFSTPCLLNDLLRECKEIYTQYCYEIECIGQSHSLSSFTFLITGKDEANAFDLYDFLSTFRIQIGMKCAELSKVLNEDLTDEISALPNRLKDELSLISGAIATSSLMWSQNAISFLSPQLSHT
jgi:hypothetical protein